MAKKVLLTGATGYIGKRLLPDLVNEGYNVICCVRDKNRFTVPPLLRSHIEVIEVDFLKEKSLEAIPKDIEAAYYLMHSMSSTSDYEKLEFTTANNFRKVVSSTNAKHVIYLSGITNEKTLSTHLNSRKSVEKELSKGAYHFTTLRAGIIIGSGSASFEIIRDLSEKLPFMITPKWLRTKCQPIGIKDVISFLKASLFNEKTYDQNFDIGGPDILSYKEMLLGYASARGLKRTIWTIPLMTPKLSSYWLYFVTSTSYKLASSLVESMKIEVICRNNDINKILGIRPISYSDSIKRTLQVIEGDQIISSWKDSMISGEMEIRLNDFLTVPTFGCFVDKRIQTVEDRERSIERIWSIGGNIGWYYGDWLWKIRGFLDQIWGGVGLRRGRKSDHQLNVGDAVDFWRVLIADKEKGRLLLFAEMKLPGEAWLEFELTNNRLKQTATFRPKGLMGRLYWYAVLPFHGFIFKGMLNKLSA
ncbi:Uncharacterized conserved protein YbjT, contains NAD(P)-binding and DUF2867 domains [Spirosomataceae bacterium TFI 002]|nr:Uncharacterized conserved protein YbjT, contains NAD(P)-binding and DUF2867 domains [Spirosomataceae bacterium TFI 002]